MTPLVRAFLVALLGVSLFAVTAPARAGLAPLIANEQTKLVTADWQEHSSSFGLSVAVSGDTAVFGAPMNENLMGSAYIFVRNGSGWSEQAKLLSDGVYSNFGYSVAISGDTVVIGAPTDVGRGAAYVFVRDGTSWSLQAKLTPSNQGFFFMFGSSVAIEGDTAIVGAYGEDVGDEGGAGSAYIFVRSGSSWSEQARLTASDGRSQGLFGNAIAISGDSALVGAVDAAYLFSRNGSSWSEQAKLVATDWERADDFGRSVAISGDTAVVGAPGASHPETGWKTGAVYLFRRAGPIWVQQAKLLASDASEGGQFGHSVALSVDTLAVGARGHAAYVFLGGIASWSERAELVPSDLGGTDNTFGDAIALSGTTVVVGAAWATINPENWDAAGYVFSLSFSPGVTVSPGAGLVTTEWGGAAPFLVVLDSQPTGDVVIDLTSSDPDEGSVSPAQLFFTPDDWRTPQTVTLTGVNDFVKDDNQPFSAIVSINTDLTADANYDGIDPPDTSAINLGLEGELYTVIPCRVLDTRQPEQGPGLVDHVKRLVTFHDTCGVPATAGAVAINVTVVEPTSPGILMITPGDLALPNVSSFVFLVEPARSLAGNAIVLLATDKTGTLAVWPSLTYGGGHSIHLVIDVSGYFE